MAPQYGFDFDPDRCVQCHACEIACKSAHAAEAGITWRRVVSLWQGKFPAVVSRALSLGCMHCGEPACMSVCPARAITKRASDGIVLVDADKCIGCKTCFWACPFGVPQYGSSGKMQKCDLCSDRLVQGLDPVCVATCPAEAIHSGPMEELSAKKAQKAARKLIMPLMATKVDEK
jgi:anaerobic dimethyl sulfoxide reductase subunit B